jgi:predicted transport protein
MPLFEITQQSIKVVEQMNFDTEKKLQSLVEKNLQTVFNSRLVASEFPTGAMHAGRIDTLALSEDNNPVLIEYKKVESSDLINQSLFYLSWINDHRGDFEIAARKAIGNDVEIDWSDIRVICIAPNYRKYDLHAVQMMGANIELWTYRLFKNSTLYLEEVFHKTYQSSQVVGSEGKNPVMVAAGKKAAITRRTASYTFDEHLKGKSEKIKNLAIAIQEYVTELDPAIEESPKKLYIAYKISQNIVCMEIQAQKITLFLKLNPKDLDHIPAIARDVTDKGHWGTGDLEIIVKTVEDFEIAKKYIEMAYQKIGS